ncbi:GNAT family N-acetyltransferase [Duganella sp. FT92W]|uniref:GNAT family N-acetyltransferase n=1 Tax=Pseudoduganella rivuli TaxID=2666085 RepID=A0A7X2LWZ2_9BURK|nr:GNAT family N-acetyltransferase [Pseudoduganella rivuli]MRV75647.1 GNAT family N-acetyltransferase [Pseudoduganella rivuli]
MQADLAIRAALASDVALLADLIRELAVAEDFPHAVTVTPADLLASLFGPRPAAHALIAEAEGRVAGFAVYYETFATTTGKRGLHLDDLFVRPAFQGRGYGKALLAHVANIARQRHCARFEWWALNTNEAALRFYASVGARRKDELVVHRVQGDAIGKLANGEVNG